MLNRNNLIFNKNKFKVAKHGFSGLKNNGIMGYSHNPDSPACQRSLEGIGMNTIDYQWFVTNCVLGYCKKTSAV